MDADTMTIDAEMLKHILNHEHICYNDMLHALSAQVKKPTIDVIVDRYTTSQAQAEEATAQVLEQRDDRRGY